MTLLQLLTDACECEQSRDSEKEGGGGLINLISLKKLVQGRRPWEAAEGGLLVMLVSRVS